MSRVALQIVNAALSAQGLARSAVRDALTRRADLGRIAGAIAAPTVVGVRPDAHAIAATLLLV